VFNTDKPFGCICLIYPMSDGKAHGFGCPGRFVIGEEVKVTAKGRTQTGWIEAFGHDAMLGGAKEAKVRCSDGERRWVLLSKLG
jgi:hypothetical protein